jgi:hypothetical protein
LETRRENTSAAYKVIAKGHPATLTNALWHRVFRLLSVACMMQGPKSGPDLAASAQV